MQNHYEMTHMTHGAWVLNGMVVCNAAMPDATARQCRYSYDRLCQFYSLFDNYSSTLSAAASEILNQRP